MWYLNRDLSRTRVQSILHARALPEAERTASSQMGVQDAIQREREQGTRVWGRRARSQLWGWGQSGKQAQLKGKTAFKLSEILIYWRVVEQGMSNMTYLFKIYSRCHVKRHEEKGWSRWVGGRPRCESRQEMAIVAATSQHSPRAQG